MADAVSQKDSVPSLAPVAWVARLQDLRVLMYPSTLLLIGAGSTWRGPPPVAPGRERVLNAARAIAPRVSLNPGPHACACVGAVRCAGAGTAVGVVYYASHRALAFERQTVRGHGFESLDFLRAVHLLRVVGA